MAQPTLEILLRLRDEASKGLADASKGIDNMGKTYKVAGALMVGAATAIAGTLALCVNAAGQEEKSINLLTVAMRNVGLSYNEVRGSLEEWMDVQTKKTGTDDEAQRRSLAALILQTKDLAKAQDLMTVAMDIAAGTGRDLEDATHLVAMALAGNWGRLQLLIPAIKAAKTEEEKWMVLRSAFAGQGEVLGKSFAGQMARIKSSIGELAEAIGNTLLPVVTKVVTIASDVLTRIGKLPPVIIYMGATIAVGAAAVLGLVGAFALLSWALPGLIAGIGMLTGVLATLGIVTGIPAIIAGITALAAVGAILWGVFKKDKDATDDLSDSALATRGAIQQLNSVIETENAKIEELTEALKELDAAYQHDKDDAAGYRDEVKRLNDAIEKHQEELADAEDKLSSLSDKYDDAKKAVSDCEDAIASANRELQGLASPRLEGMQAYEDQIFAIGQEIARANLEKLQIEAIGGDTTAIEAQIEALRNQREQIELTRDITFAPLIRQAQEAVEGIQGLNEEFAPQTVFDRIAALGKALSSDGELGIGLANAQTDLGLVNDKYVEQQGVVASLTDTIKTEQGELETLNDKIEAIYDTWETQILQQKNLIWDLHQEILAAQADLNTLATTPPSSFLPPGWSMPVGEGSWNVRPEGMQHGGIVTKPTLAMIGEAGPEAVVPLSRMGSQGGGRGDTYITVHNHIQGSIWNNSDLANEVRKNLLWIKDRNYSLGLA
jgi:predicted nuclease with TOPRIM domain